MRYLTRDVANTSRCILFISVSILFVGCEKNDYSVNQTIVYSQLSQDPTRELIISWITKDSKQSKNFRYKQVNEIKFTYINPQKKEIPKRGDLNLYTVYITDLLPGTEYMFQVAGEDIIRRTKTLPSKIPDDGIKVGFAGDAHFEGKGHNKYDLLTRAMSINGIDILVGKGDYVDCEGIIGLEQTNRWIGFLDMLDRSLSQVGGNFFYVPMILAVGNHETTPDNGTDPEAARYLRFFFDNPSKLEPLGKNYGAVKIGDYLQLIILDSWHTSYPGGEQKKWLSKVIDNSVLHSVPIMHVSPFPTYRHPNVEVSVSIRKEWFEILYNAGNIRIAFDSHEHSWKRTVSLGIANKIPNHHANEADIGFFYLGNSTYITKSDPGIIFFGDGSWGSDSRSRWNPSTTWYLKDTQDRLNVYKTGHSGISHENDGKIAGSFWEHIYIAIFKSHQIEVKSINPAGQIFNEIIVNESLVF